MTIAPATVRPIAEGLRAADPLTGLLQRVRASQERLDALRGIVPSALRAQLRAGPLDEEGWTIMASNSAVAAKLRQLLPDIEAGFKNRGLAAMPTRVRVQAP